jgi:CheY-like chemotaxis protein
LVSPPIKDWEVSRTQAAAAANGLVLASVLSSVVAADTERITLVVEGDFGMLTRRVEDAVLPGKSKKPLAGYRILVAEDEALIALELEEILENLGCEVVGPLSRVDDVLEAAERGGFDGALLDINLRGRQIFEILPQLKTLGLNLIITSGYDDLSLFPVAFRGMPRIAKPFNEKELRRICETVFSKAAKQ